MMPPLFFSLIPRTIFVFLSICQLFSRTNIPFNHPDVLIIRTPYLGTSFQQKFRLRSFGGGKLLALIKQLHVCNPNAQDLLGKQEGQLLDVFGRVVQVKLAVGCRIALWMQYIIQPLLRHSFNFTFQYFRLF